MADVNSQKDSDGPSHPHKDMIICGMARKHPGVGKRANLRLIYIKLIISTRSALKIQIILLRLTIK